MPAHKHFTKGRYGTCDTASLYMQGIFSANKVVIQLIIEEFDRVRMSRGVSEVTVLKELRMSGAIISRNGLWNYRKGVFHTCSTTYLNILSVWAGYKDFIDLVYCVRSRENGEARTA